jgi:hypothetical protein
VIVRPQCFGCQRLTAEPPLRCDAFPDGIPDEIVWNEFDHANPFPGDHGLRRIEAGAAEGRKSLKAGNRDGTPSADAILARALEETGHGDAWEAGTLDDDGRREVLTQLIAHGETWFRSEADALLVSVAPAEAKALFGSVREKVGAFFGRAGKFIRELFTAGVLAVSGPGSLTQAQEDALNREVDVQLEYLEDFKKQIVTEERPLGTQFAARTTLYSASLWGNVLEVERQGVIAVGAMTEEMRVLGQAAEHCHSTAEQAGCVELAKRGWVRIGSSPRIGDTPCKTGCRCHFTYR